MESGDRYDKLDDSPDLPPTGDKEGLLLDDLGKKKGKTGNSGNSEADVDSPLRKPKKVLESSKAILADQSRGLRLIVICAFIFSLVITVALILSIYLGPPQIGANAAVATDVKECSKIGLNILKQGGNAVDAAVASMFCVGVVNPESSGIGGGGFMLVHDHKTHKSEVFDFRETAPLASKPDMFSGDPKKRRVGGLAVAVPGELRGMETAHKKYGKLSWNSVVKPAADLARKGFPMSGHTAHVFNSSTFDMDTFLKSELSSVFMESDGITPLKEGSLIKRPDLAKTLDKIAADGADAFYTGDLADDIITAVVENDIPGHMTKDDLKNYKVETREVVSTTYKGYTIESAPAPSSGPVVLSIMNILEGYDLKQDGQSYHRIVEALKFGFANKDLLGDPLNQPSIENVTNIIISKDAATEIRNKTANVNKTMDASFYSNLVGLPIDNGTSHISVIDSSELMVSVTTTVNDWFGSLVVTDSGIVLNNEMADFSQPGGAKMNQIAPNRRPMSSTSPTVVYQTGHPCGLRMVLGGAGGTGIISGVVETLLNNLTFGMSLENAIKSPRLHSQLTPDPSVVEVEPGFPEDIKAGLTSRGHKVKVHNEVFNEIQAVLKIKDGIEAYSDERKSGAGADLFTS